MGESDTHIRNAINRGLIPGPRLFVATKVLASTGSYEPRTESEHTCLPTGGEAVDGVESARVAVRRRIAAGADVIKFFADYRRRVMRYPPLQQHPYIPNVLHLPAEPNPDILVFEQAEMDMIVSEAKLAKCPVACHAGTIEGAIMAVKAGASTIEHAYFGNDGLYNAMRDSGCVFVPTLTVCEVLHAKRYGEIRVQAKRAHELGVRLACGGDIGICLLPNMRIANMKLINVGPVHHGANAREMELMVDAGIPIEDVLEACTVGGWESVGKELCGLKFGWFEEGARADIIALATDPRQDKLAMRKVEFVMKDAQVWKMDGKAVNMVQDNFEWPETFRTL